MHGIQGSGILFHECQRFLPQQQSLPGLVLLLITVVALADTTHGWVEKSFIMPWNVVVKATLDSDALTSSFHAEDIERFEHDGEAGCALQWSSRMKPVVNSLPNGLSERVSVP